MASQLDQYPVKRQADGWPEGITDDQKKELCGFGRSILERYPNGIDLGEFYRALSRHNPTAFKNAVILDWLYCASLRTLWAIKANEVWKPQVDSMGIKSGQKAKLIVNSKGEQIRMGAKGTGKLLWSVCYKDIKQYIFSRSESEMKLMAQDQRQRWMDLHGWKWKSLEDIKQGVMEKD